MSLIKLFAIVFALLTGTAVTVGEYLDSYSVEAAGSPLQAPQECASPSQHCKQLGQELLMNEVEEVVVDLHTA